ncbi:hypothetical protein BKI52_37200 [marine bacterium AO1-C]|nr:hypothetical protein BKI52_37200 [marine bacterium AO1-C]
MKYLRKTFIILLFLGVVFNTHSIFGQMHSIGLVNGLSSNQLVIDDRQNLNILRGNIQYVGGLRFDFALGKRLFLESGLNFEQNLITAKYFDYFPRQDVKFRFSYLAVPISLSYRIGNKFQLFGRIGIAPSVLLNANRTAQIRYFPDPSGLATHKYVISDIPDGQATESFRYETESLDISRILGAGIALNFAKVRFTLEARYDRSFFNFDKEDVSFIIGEAHHSSIDVLFGVFYKL